MSKTTYKQLNPGIVLVVAGQVCSPPISMEIFNEDGTPVVYQEPSDEQMAPIIAKVMSAFPAGVDLRTVTMALMMIEELNTNAARQCVHAVHQLMHQPVTEHLDSQLMHEGLAAYMDGTTIKAAETITPENVGDHVLSRFFPDTSKPN